MSDDITTQDKVKVVEFGNKTTELQASEQEFEQLFTKMLDCLNRAVREINHSTEQEVRTINIVLPTIHFGSSDE